MKKKDFVTLIMCTVGGILFALGMCMVMVWEMMIPGIIVGIIGIAGIMSAYPLYTRITKKQQEKLAPEIIRLTDELMK